MIERFTHRLADVVTTHNRLVIVLILLLTAGVAFGLTMDSERPATEVDGEAIDESDVYQGAEYLAEHYGDPGDGPDETVNVYAWDPEESVLSQEGILASLEFQQALEADQTVGPYLADDAFHGPPNLVATQLANDPDADLEAQYEAVSAAEQEDIEAVVSSTFVGGEETRFFMPSSYETGSTDAEGLRMTIALDLSADEDEVPPEVETTIHELGAAQSGPDIYTDGMPAIQEMSSAYLGDVMWLVIPPILIVLLGILAFTYRDVTDVLIGFSGTVLALIWSMGLMGWMGLMAQDTAIIVPVLIAALSIDFGFHVFMRYREHRGPEIGIRTALRRSMTAVAIAFLLVTVTAAIGFLSNLTSPVPVIRDLGVAITLGVVATLIIFVTIVPALKVSADGLWERFGYDRRKTPLGKGRYLSRVLGTGAAAAKHAAIIVVALALVVGTIGGLAFGELDREPFQEGDFAEVPEWQTELPGPMAFEAHESDPVQRLTFAQNEFQADQSGFDADNGGEGFTQLLMRGEDVATADAMLGVQAAQDAAESTESDAILHQGEAVHVVSPLTVMEEVAAQDEEFAATFDAADTTGDGVPDRHVGEVLDELYASAPEQAALVVERTDDGSYESMVVLVPAQGFGTERAETMHDIADSMADESGHEVTAVGIATINAEQMAEITDGILLTVGIAMFGVMIVLSLVFRVVRGSATLGVITALPIALALGIVFGGMYLLEQPLTLLTALLVGITIGLGIDYNIHLSDRYADERSRGRDRHDALYEAVTGTGGALFGSAVTSGTAFALMVLIPDPQLSSFGLIVALALAASFALSVFVLPSLIALQDRLTGGTETAGSTMGVPQD